MLPCVLDVGTDNEELLESPYYFGLQQKRLKGEEYIAVVDEFIQAVKNRLGFVLSFRFDSKWFPPTENLWNIRGISSCLNQMARDF